MFYLHQPGCMINRQTLYHGAVKAGFYSKQVEVFYIYLDPVTHTYFGRPIKSWKPVCIRIRYHDMTEKY